MNDKPEAGAVEEGYPAKEAGIQAGDTIVKMGEKRIHIFREISIYNQFHQGEEVEVTYRRGNDEKTVVLQPKKDEESGYYRLGISSTGYTKANVLTAMQYGVYEVKYLIDVTLGSLKMLVTGQVGMDQMAGPVGMVDVVGSTYEQSKSYGSFVVLAELMNLAILLTANLGVMNLLPLPALDGGRLVFLFVEAIRRKRVPPEKEGYVHLVGIVLLTCR